MELKIDPELKAFMPPLSEAEQAALEANIIANGCRVPLVVWDGTIVDGHHRYEICRRHNIPITVEEQSFADKGEAKLWMLQEQRSRRNMGTVARTVKALELKPILLEKGKQTQGHRSDLDNLFTVTKGHNTRQMIADIAGTSETMVHRIEKIMEAADEATMNALMREEIKVGPTFAKLFPKKKPQVDEGKVQDGESQASAKAPDDEQATCESEIQEYNPPATASGVCKAFLDSMNRLIREAEMLDNPIESAYSLVGEMQDVINTLANEMFRRVTRLVCTDEEEDFDFDFVDTCVSNAISMSNDMLDTALYNLCHEDCTVENLQKLVQMLQKEHTDQLAVLKKNVEYVLSCAEEPYSPEKNAELLSVIDGELDGYSDEEIEIEYYKRKLGYTDSDKVKEHLEITFEVEPNRMDAYLPASPIMAESTFNVLSHGFQHNIRALIELTPKKYLTKEFIKKLFGRIDALPEEIGCQLDYSLSDRLGQRYKPKYLEDEENDPGDEKPEKTTAGENLPEKG